MNVAKRLISLAAVIALAACSSVTNGTAWVPPQQQVSLGNLGKITFAVGTATLQDGTTGLNVVAYVRQSNGSTAYLVNSPTITGPSGFVVPTNSATSGNVDAGTGSITSTAQGASTSTTFGTYGGVYGGGIGPFNATQTSSNFYPGHPPSGQPNTYLTPLYGIGTAAGAPVSLLVGPPAVSPFTNIDFPPGFAGYLPGFTSFEAAPVTGQYGLKIFVGAANAQSATLTATANLASAAPALGAIAAPTFTKDGAGGGTVTFTAPAGTVQSLVFVEDTKASVYFTAGPVSGAGPQSATIGDNLGPCGAPPCGTTSIPAGDAYSVTVVSFDYSDFQSTQPGSTSQAPSLGLPSSGQADISVSPSTTGTY